MSINDATIQVERTASYAPRRVPTRRMIAFGVATLVFAIVGLAAVMQQPSETLQPAPQSRDEIVRDLVDRGLVPAATLDD